VVNVDISLSVLRVYFICIYECLGVNRRFCVPSSNDSCIRCMGSHSIYVCAYCLATCDLSWIIFYLSVISTALSTAAFSAVTSGDRNMTNCFENVTQLILSMCLCDVFR
jgi:hypothetical protein